METEEKKEIDKKNLSKNKQELIKIILETMKEFTEFFKEFKKNNLTNLNENWKHEKWKEVIDNIFKKIKEKKENLNVIKDEIINSLILVSFPYLENNNNEDRLLITNYFSEIWEEIKEKNEINLSKILSIINSINYNKQFKFFANSYNFLTNFSNKKKSDTSQNIFVNHANINYSLERYDMNYFIKDCEEIYDKSNLWKRINLEDDLEEELEEELEDVLEEETKKDLEINLEEKLKVISEVYFNLERNFKKYEFFLVENLKKLNINSEIEKFYKAELDKWKKNIETKNKKLADTLSKEVIKEQKRVNNILQQKWQNRSKTVSEEQEKEVSEVYQMYLYDWHLIRNAWSFSSILPFFRTTTTTVQPDSVRYKIILDRISYAKANEFANSEITNYLKTDIRFIILNKLINFIVEKKHYNNFSNDFKKETSDLLNFGFKLYKEYNSNVYPSVEFKRKNINKLFGEEEKDIKLICRKLPIKYKDSFWKDSWKIWTFNYYKQFFSKNFNENNIKQPDKFVNSDFQTRNWFKNTGALIKKNWATNQFDYRFCKRTFIGIWKRKNSSKINIYSNLFSDPETNEEFQKFLCSRTKIKWEQEREEAKLELEDKTKLVVDITEKYKNILEKVNTFLYEKAKELESFKNNKENKEDNEIKEINKKINAFIQILNETTEKTKDHTIEERNNEIKKLYNEFSNNFNLYAKKFNLNDEAINKIKYKVQVEEIANNKSYSSFSNNNAEPSTSKIEFNYLVNNDDSHIVNDLLPSDLEPAYKNMIKAKKYENDLVKTQAEFEQKLNNDSGLGR